MKIKMKRLFMMLVFFLFNSLLVFCGGKNNKLKILEEYKLQVPEPSGLALSADGKNLWTVSDQNSTIYLLSFDGKIKKKFTVDAEDIEGITVVNDSAIAVVSEQSGEVLILSRHGKLLSRHKLTAESKKNTGVEGITYDAKMRRFFIVKEKKPRLLFEYDSRFNELRKTKINFADDLSGLCFTGLSNDLWIISDESKLIAKCKPDGEVVSQRKISIDQIEGIAVDLKAKKIYLVSDKEEKLYAVEFFN